VILDSAVIYNSTLHIGTTANNQRNHTPKTHIWQNYKKLRKKQELHSSSHKQQPHSNK
jgi:hypothetical protein